MNRKTLSLALGAALVASLSLTACKKNEPAPAPAPEAAAPAPVAAPAPAPAPAAAPAVAPLSVLSVDLGNAVGADNKIAAPATSFSAANDKTIYASVNTGGVGDGHKLAAKWTFQNGQTIGAVEEKAMTGENTVYEFHMTTNKAWPVGKYKVEISLDGAVVQTKDFEIK